jgi:hypothetical protein
VLVNRRAEILIQADPETIWEFANDPNQWMASNTARKSSSTSSPKSNAAPPNSGPAEPRNRGHDRLAQRRDQPLEGTLAPACSGSP